MANIKISLSKDKKINNTNVYLDVDVDTKYAENTLRDRRSIENSLSNLLSWKQRERIMNPKIGNSLWNRVFDNFSGFTQKDIRNEVMNILSFEPRISIEDISVDMSIEESEVTIIVKYYIPDLGNSYGDKELSTYTITVTNH